MDLKKITFLLKILWKIFMFTVGDFYMSTLFERQVDV